MLNTDFTDSTDQTTPHPRRMTDFQTKFGIGLLYGFYFLDKLFVYVAFSLAALAAFDRRVFFDRIYTALTTRGPLHTYAWVLLLSTVYGIAGVIYGVMAGNQLVTAIQVLMFNICPWFLFLGIAAGMKRPFIVRDYIRFMAWFQAISTPLYYLIFRHITLHIGDGETNLFQPGSGALVIIGLLCYEKSLSRFWFPLLVCSFNTIAIEIRADWVGLGMALFVWALATKQVTRLAYIAGILVVLLAIGFAADIRMQALPGRGGELSARDTIGRALSGIDPEIAQEYSSNAGTYAGTVKWRETWWKAIREAVFERPETTMFGLGYGYPIGKLVTYIKGDVRTPHSVLYFTLAYSGLAGVFMFALLLLSLCLVHWKTYKQTGQIFGLCSLVFLTTISLFGNFFESPQRSVPTYILWGMCIGPLFIKRRAQGQNKALVGDGPPYGPLQSRLEDYQYGRVVDIKS